MHWKSSVKSTPSLNAGFPKKGQPALESFAASLAVLDSYNFHRIVGPRMELLVVTTMIQDEETFVIATSLLQSSNVTSEFTSCLMDFLINRMDYLDTSCTDHTDKKKQGSVTLQLFVAIFNSISKFTKNEAVLRPHLQLLIASCLRRRATANDVDTWPSNCIQLLRSLFRSIAGGKFEESYKEILPLLPILLNGLYRIYSVTLDDTLRNSIIEFCLTVQLDYLHYFHIYHCSLESSSWLYRLTVKTSIILGRSSEISFLFLHIVTHDDNQFYFINHQPKNPRILDR